MEPQDSTAEVTEITKPWYTSRGVIGSVVATAALTLSLAGFSIGAGLQAELVDAIIQVVGVGGGVYSLVGRLLASKKLV